MFNKVKDANYDMRIQADGGSPLLELELDDGVERSWEVFKKILKENDHISVDVDLRKSSKTHTPLLLKPGCCDDSLEIKRKKDFPLEDLKCKCNSTYLVKYV